MVSAWREQLSARLAEPSAGRTERATELASIRDAGNVSSWHLASRFLSGSENSDAIGGKADIR